MLGPIPRRDFTAFLERGFTDSGIVVERGAAGAILDAAEQVPYNVQLLAHTSWDVCREAMAEATEGAENRADGPAQLTHELVWHTRSAVALRSDPIYTQLWSGLPSTQQRALLALLREHGEGLASTAVARRYQMPISTLDKSLKLLEKKGVVREEQARGAVQLRLEDPLFGAWIKLVVPA
jgi:DNA-binding transcriptional ArsR family regulator